MESRKVQRRTSIRSRIRRIITGTAERPRLSVFRSNKQIYAQLINDVTGSTIAAASSAEAAAGTDKSNKSGKAEVVGKLIAERAISAGITEVVFDRGGYLFHGRVKSLADGARNGGLKF
jgi:large subunit ribosomal protein L18